MKEIIRVVKGGKGGKVFPNFEKNFIKMFFSINFFKTSGKPFPLSPLFPPIFKEKIYLDYI